MCRYTFLNTIFSTGLYFNRFASLLVFQPVHSFFHWCMFKPVHVSTASRFNRFTFQPIHISTKLHNSTTQHIPTRLPNAACVASDQLDAVTSRHGVGVGVGDGNGDTCLPLLTVPLLDVERVRHPDAETTRHRHVRRRRHRRVDDGARHHARHRHVNRLLSTPTTLVITLKSNPNPDPKNLTQSSCTSVGKRTNNENLALDISHIL